MISKLEDSRKVVAIIQARMASSRLPGKVLMDIEGQTMLARVYNRLGHSQRIQECVIAITTDSSDDVLAAYCQQEEMPLFRGHPTDVLDRYYHVATNLDAECVIRVTADCPLIDATVVDLAIERFLSARPPVDLVANRLPEGRTYPVGLDVEVVSYQALQTAWQHADRPYQREHVLPFIYDQPEKFRVIRVDHPVDYGLYRWTVDEEADLDLVRELYHRLGNRSDFSWLDVIELYEKDPTLKAINQGVHHKTHRDVDPRGVT